MRLVPKTPNSLMTKRVIEVELEWTPENYSGAADRAAANCASLCRDHQFSDGRSCGSFEATVEFFDNDDQSLGERITCFLHTEGLYADSNPAMLVADFLSYENGGNSMHLVGTMDNNDGQERTCRA
jgi:hypothetical protein